MAARTKIEWTDATVNFWWGCTRVGPGCDHCYAEIIDRRFGGAHWGHDAPRRKIKDAVRLLHRLDNAYADWAADHVCRARNTAAAALPTPESAIRRRVMIQSMGDLFDLAVPPEWFDEAWRTIAACDRVDIQIITKRGSAIERRLAGRAWPRHAGLLVTVCNQAEAERDVPRLLDIKRRLGIPWVGLSCEPLLGPMDISRWLRPRARPNADGYGGDHAPGWTTDFNRLDWVIVGGESGSHARPMHPDWARSMRDQCQEAGAAFFFKQWGDPSRAGNLLDGRRHMEWPAPLSRPDRRAFPLGGKEDPTP